MNQPATTLDQLTTKAGQLYTLPAVAMQVLDLTADPTVDTQALKSCIENDPALTTKLLRVVNSSLFGLSRHVSDLNQALALLGIKPLKLLVLGFSLPGQLFQDIAGDVLTQYWRHTLVKAVAAREIVETLWRHSGDEAFLAGLLQDLGSLLLIQELGEPYVELIRSCRSRGFDLLECETRSLGFDHTTLSACMLERWRLPQVLIVAVEAGAPSPERSAAEPEPANLRPVLRLAELISRLLADRDTGVLGRLLTSGRQLCGLTTAKLDALVENLEEKVRQLADVLCLQLPDSAGYADILTHAHQRLAEVASDAAAEILAGRQQGDGNLVPEDGATVCQVTSLCDAVAEAAHRPDHSPRSPKFSRNSPGRSPATATCEPTGAPRATPAHPSDAHRSVAPDAALIEQLSADVATCRQSRSPLSLLLLDAGDATELFLRLGREGYGRLHDFLEAVCRNLDPSARCLPHGEAGFAIVLPGCERQGAVQAGNELMDQVRRLVSRCLPGNPRGVSPAVGAATVSLPPRNFPAEDLFAAADRCLNGSRLSGGGLKSIEIY